MSDFSVVVWLHHLILKLSLWTYGTPGEAEIRPAWNLRPVLAGFLNLWEPPVGDSVSYRPWQNHGAEILQWRASCQESKKFQEFQEP